MTWTKYKFKQEEIATFLERDDFPTAMREYLVTNDGVPMMSWFRREFAVNDDGVWIEQCGSTQRGWTVLFRYWHKDVWVKFNARRPAGRDDNWVNYDPTNKTNANFALGPLCRVLIDDRHRRLSPDEEKLVKENITEFLTKEFHDFEFAFPPYPEPSTLFELKRGGRNALRHCSKCVRESAGTCVRSVCPKEEFQRSG